MIQISCIPYQLPLSAPIKTSQVDMAHRDGSWVVLEMDGMYGVGDVATWPGFGSDPQKLNQSLLTLPDRWDSARLRLSATFENIRETPSEFIDAIRALGDFPELQAALEVAGLDLIARTLQVPLAQLLAQMIHGGEPERSVATHKQIKNLPEIDDGLAEGYETFKLKVGYAEHWTMDATLLARLVAAIPQGQQLCVDANRGWDHRAARAFSICARAYEVAWLEEPLSSGSLERHAKLGIDTQVRIGIDETVGPLWYQAKEDVYTFIQNIPKGIHALTLKPLFLGGLLNTATIAREVSEAGYQPCITHGFESSVGRNATSALVGALTPIIPSIRAGLLGGPNDGICIEYPVKRGRVHVSDTIGVGKLRVEMLEGRGSI